MPEGQFESLRLELLRRGVTPVYVERAVLELEEHYSDLESAALASGIDPDEAARVALATLGDERVIAAAILAYPELLTFSTRYPRVARCLTLPGLPLIFCIEHRPELTRWVAAVGLAATLMGGVLAMLNWLIVVPF
jgi:hypothetical protein